MKEEEKTDQGKNKAEKKKIRALPIMSQEKMAIITEFSKKEHENLITEEKRKSGE